MTSISLCGCEYGIIFCTIINYFSGSGQDYEAMEMDVMLTSEETLKNITISIIDDALSEPLETFLLRLSPSPNSPNTVSINPISQAVVTIMDDDGRPAST